MNWNNVLRKMRFREDLKSRYINLPQHFQNELDNLISNRVKNKATKSQFTILFTKNEAEVDKLMKSTIETFEYDSIFWVAYPKGGSSIKTDISRDILWELLKPYGYRPVSQVAIDSDWSAMRFRPMEKVGGK